MTVHGHIHPPVFSASAKGTFRILTLGCKVNQYESAHLHESLEKAGWMPARDGEPALLTAVNTCVVTAQAARQSRQALRKAIRRHPQGLVAALGCYAQAFPEELLSMEGLSFIADNRSKPFVADRLIQAASQKGQILCLQGFEPGTPFAFQPLENFPGRTRAYLKIQDGCESCCSYCIVPLTRGPYRSLAPERVLAMLETFARKGFREVVLTGIHLGKYGVDLPGGWVLASLLDRILRERYPLRIRLSSVEPNEMGRDLIEMVASGEGLCRHFHIPLQSGDSQILKRMNRRFTREAFAGLIEALYAAIPEGAIGVDVMAGFPGEDQGAHHNTCSLLRDLPVSYLHVFPYSPRPGTPAVAFPDPVPGEVIRQRARELREIGHQKRRRFYAGFLHTQVSVLVEGGGAGNQDMGHGTTDNYLPVRFEGQAREGDLVGVHLRSLGSDGLEGVFSPSHRVEASDLHG